MGSRVVSGRKGNVFWTPALKDLYRAKTELWRVWLRALTVALECGSAGVAAAAAACAKGPHRLDRMRAATAAAAEEAFTAVQAPSAAAGVRAAVAGELYEQARKVFASALVLRLSERGRELERGY